MFGLDLDLIPQPPDEADLQRYSTDCEIWYVDFLTSGSNADHEELRDPVAAIAATDSGPFLDRRLPGAWAANPGMDPS